MTKISKTLLLALPMVMFGVSAFASNQCNDLATLEFNAAKAINDYRYEAFSSQLEGAGAELKTFSSSLLESSTKNFTRAVFDVTCETEMSVVDQAVSTLSSQVRADDKAQKALLEVLKLKFNSVQKPISHVITANAASVTCQIEVEVENAEKTLIYSEVKSSENLGYNLLEFEKQFSTDSTDYIFSAEADEDSVAFVLSNPENGFPYLVTSGMGFETNINEEWGRKEGASITFFDNISTLKKVITMTCFKD